MSGIHAGIDHADLDAQPGVGLAADLVPGVGNFFKRQSMVQRAKEDAYWMYSYYAWDGSESSGASGGNAHDHHVGHRSGFADDLGAVRFESGFHLEMLPLQRDYAGAKLGIGRVGAMAALDGLGCGRFPRQLYEVAIGYRGRDSTNTDKDKG
jgi:hypothetical protein